MINPVPVNPIRGEVPLVLPDGRELLLVMDFEGLIAGEALYGKRMPEMIVDASAGMIGAVRALLFGALRTHHPEITPREAGELVRDHGELIADAIERADAAATPPATGAEGGDGANPPGKPSGASGAKPGSARKRSGGKPRKRSS